MSVRHLQTSGCFGLGTENADVDWNFFGMAQNRVCTHRQMTVAHQLGVVCAMFVMLESLLRIAPNLGAQRTAVTKDRCAEQAVGEDIDGCYEGLGAVPSLHYLYAVHSRSLF